MISRWEQAARYLGRPDARVEALMRRAFAALDAATQPRTVQLELPCRAAGEETALGGLTLHSRNLAQLLEHSPRALVYAATLGVQADVLIARAQVTDMAYALVLQACAAAAVEDLADRLTEAAEEALRPQGLHLTPSYSPGYGDLPLDAQGPLLELLSAPKRIGLTLTGAGLLAPVKSITAICGITAQPCRPYAAKCARCTMTNCAYRKE